MVTAQRSRVAGLGLGVLVAGLVLAFWPRAELPVQEAITRKIVRMRSAAEKKDIGALMEDVSERFKSAEGLSKQQVRGVLVGQVLRGQWLTLFQTGLDVTEVSPTRGDFTLKLVYARSDSMPPDGVDRNGDVDGWVIEGSFEKEQDGEWRVVSASHRTVKPSDIF
jgi:hypothetical protein